MGRGATTSRLHRGRESSQREWNALPPIMLLRPWARPMHVNILLTILVQIALILALSRVMGMLFKLIQQPQVVGEMLAGIMLGPSLFGLLAPNLAGRIFPPESIGLLNVLSQ